MAVVVNDCPFCGADNVTIDEVSIGEFSVACEDCRCVGPIDGDVMTAIASWNMAEKAPS